MHSFLVIAEVQTNGGDLLTKSLQILVLSHRHTLTFSR